MGQVNQLTKRAKNWIFLLIFVTLSSGCNDVLEFDNGSVNDTYFSPPNWILGTWEEIKDRQNDSPTVRSFEFTETNFIVNPLSGEFDKIDYNAYLNEMLNTFQSVKSDIKVRKSEELYELSISPPLITDNYSFRKVNDEIIICIHNNDDEFELKRRQ